MYYLEWENRFIDGTSMWFFFNYYYSVSLWMVFEFAQ